MGKLVKQFEEENKSIRFIITDDDNSLIEYYQYYQNRTELTLITTYSTFDIYMLIQWYKEGKLQLDKLTEVS